jgi:hypothetical protein
LVIGYAIETLGIDAPNLHGFNALTAVARAVRHLKKAVAFDERARGFRFGQRFDFANEVLVVRNAHDVARDNDIADERLSGAPHHVEEARHDADDDDHERNAQRDRSHREKRNDARCEVAVREERCVHSQS